MLVTPVVREFMDFRAHVSHDLCKQRLLLGLGSFEAAQRSLADSYVWPLVPDQVERLFYLGPTLFGLVTPVLEEMATRARAHLQSMRAGANTVVDGGEHGWVILRAAAEDLARLLSVMPDQLKERRPAFSEESVLAALAGRSSARCAEEARLALEEGLLPIGRGLLSGTKVRADLYTEYWLKSPEVDIALRQLVVAAAIEDRDTAADPFVLGVRRALRELDHVMTAFSPSIGNAEQPEVLREALEGLGYETGQAFLDAVVAGIRPA